MTGITAERADQLFDDWFARSRVMSILRGYDSETTVSLASRAWDVGFALVEVPLSSEAATVTLARTVEAGRARGRVVGAGTVTDAHAVDLAREVGAAFTVAPGWDPEVAEASLSAGMPHLPGVMTPSDVTAARAAGHRWLKLFPASVLGPSMVRAMLGPFPDLRFVATGGVDADNASAFLEAGASAVSLSGATQTISADHVRALSGQPRTRK
ncbi:bifunctional 4-hydroxy-2-oxoglutarate aldolase/2-dehydro-3-deoxy-phosphogluconate aldolase [Microbacterium paraoxydans]|uniref:bifunctional 4-hydroxy-2-oxoglutarate aldolase/2-dehydro-3-deoxy-phosphogluconate aldolase n=1 Tax=Microbacterium TaxID=33882 RepID=UPI0009DEB855|nr:bifunctional 4-hydroxy-2-oxoglutarate aldolase/2-dehydro-3-deoxy-phosphogluconate aldolase [Microbacterium paraoxydans]NIG66802.1 2-dehydro-3-deoxyphosphogluconate aldolase [Microbacterium sp. Be9]